MSKRPKIASEDLYEAEQEAQIERSMPVREHGMRAESVREEEVRPAKKVRVRKGGGMTDRLHIPAAMIPPDIDLQWVTSEILGMPDMQGRQAYEINGWEPVAGEMWDGLFDGMFMPKGYKGELNVGGLVLMWRPMELTMEARAEESQAARQAVRNHEAALRGGEIKGVTLDTAHPSARAKTHLTRQVLSGIQVPRD